MEVFMTIGGTSLMAPAQAAMGALENALDTQASLVGQLMNGSVQNTADMLNAALAEIGKGTKLNMTV